MCIIHKKQVFASSSEFFDISISISIFYYIGSLHAFYDTSYLVYMDIVYPFTHLSQLQEQSTSICPREYKVVSKNMTQVMNR